MEKAKTKSGVEYRLRTRNVGTHFGTVGQVVARNGRVVRETEVVPYKFDQAALGRARAIVEEMP